jgi:hypothetical protein
MPGKYSATYTLAYGENIEFGEKIFINFEVSGKDEAVEESNVSRLINSDFNK